MSAPTSGTPLRPLIRAKSREQKKEEVDIRSGEYQAQSGIMVQNLWLDLFEKIKSEYEKRLNINCHKGGGGKQNKNTIVSIAGIDAFRSCQLAYEPQYVSSLQNTSKIYKIFTSRHENSKMHRRTNAFAYTSHVHEPILSMHSREEEQRR